MLLFTNKKHSLYLKLLAILIAFIFSFEAVGYSAQDTTYRTNLRVPMGGSTDRVKPFVFLTGTVELMLAKSGYTPDLVEKLHQYITTSSGNIDMHNLNTLISIIRTAPRSNNKLFTVYKYLSLVKTMLEEEMVYVRCYVPEDRISEVHAAIRRYPTEVAKKAGHFRVLDFVELQDRLGDAGGGFIRVDINRPEHMNPVELADTIWHELFHEDSMFMSAEDWGEIAVLAGFAGYLDFSQNRYIPIESMEPAEVKRVIDYYGSWVRKEEDRLCCYVLKKDMPKYQNQPLFQQYKIEVKAVPTISDYWKVTPDEAGAVACAKYIKDSEIALLLQSGLGNVVRILVSRFFTIGDSVYVFAPDFGEKALVKADVMPNHFVIPPGPNNKERRVVFSQGKAKVIVLGKSSPRVRQEGAIKAIPDRFIRHVKQSI